MTQTPVTARPSRRPSRGWRPSVGSPVSPTETFKAGFARAAARTRDRPASSSGPTPGTTIFIPTTAQAAVEVLEAAGFQVVVPQASLCCGRPLYDYGMLDAGQAPTASNPGHPTDGIRAGVCIVGLEPSCVSVFRDEPSI